jgi:putative sterol carrier protein
MTTISEPTGREPQASGVVIDYVVQERKKELARHRVVVDGDTVHAADDTPGDAAVTFTLTPALADQLAHGTLDLSVGFMRGEVKMAGDFGALLHVLPTLAKTSGL